MKKLASGHGLFKMLDISKRRGLNNNNSVLHIRDKSDLNSYWYITEKD